MTPLGNFESGGGQPVDFWKVKLLGGDKVQLALSMPANLCCSSSYDFNLYPPGTTDTKFPQVAPVANVAVDNSTKATVVLQAPRSGTFTLAVCENISGDCRGTDSGQGSNPMSAYTFTPRLVGGTETKTALFLSASSIKHGSEKKLKVSVKVTAQFSGTSRWDGHDLGWEEDRMPGQARQGQGIMQPVIEHAAESGHLFSGRVLPWQ